MKTEWVKAKAKRVWAAGRVFRAMAIFLVLVGLVGGVRGAGIAAKEMMHPMMAPATFTDHAVCENCGMNRNMWARTRHTFQNPTGTHYTCSMHCLADLSQKAAEEPVEVKVALYTVPEREIRGKDAVYVVGSSAPGTMTMNSKLAFASKEEAMAFAAEKGGMLKVFPEAFSIATAELPMARKKIAEKRLQTGKIVLPTATDRCQVCDMMPAEFPDHRSQILTMDNRTIHFCSTNCLTKFNAEPVRYIDPAPKPKMHFVTVYPEQVYDYAGGLYYVVGSSVMGSMGPEALPFRKKAEAESFAKENGGQVLLFSELTPERIGGMKMH